MSVWERARDGRLTAVVGTPPPPPRDLPVVRCRCGNGIAGLSALAARIELPTDELLALANRPLVHRLLEDLSAPEPTRTLVTALRAIAGERVVVISQVERCGTDAEPILQALVQAGDVPVVLVANQRTPVIDAARERLGNAGLVEHGTPQTPLAALPTDVLEVLVAAAAHRGPIDLDTLAALCHRDPSAVLASLQGAFVRGVPIEDDGEGLFVVDGDLLDELRSITLPTWARRLASEDKPTTLETPTPLEAGRAAVAIGAWPAARRLFARAGDLGAAEHAALAWAMSDLPAARALFPADHVHARMGVLWDLGELDEAETLAADVPGLPGLLDRATLAIARGALDTARTRIDDVLATATEETRTTALHLSAVLALSEASPDLDTAHAQALEALASIDETDGAHRGRLLETAARIDLRRKNHEEAAAAFLEALPLLHGSEQALATARATLGLAESTDLTQNAAQVLAWLDRAVRLNRRRAEGLVWCRSTLQVLMERVPVSGRATSLTDLRRVSLELAALVAQFRQLPTPAPI